MARQELLELEVRHGRARRSPCRASGGACRGGRGRSARRSCLAATAASRRRARGTRGSARGAARAAAAARRPPASARRRAGPTCRGRGGGRCPGRSSSPPAAPAAASACASVPPACPGAGCTTTPAGLSTTRRCSSAYATVSSGSAAARLRGGRRRRLDRELLPTRELVALRRAPLRPRARRPPRGAAPPRRASPPPAAPRDGGRAALPRPRRDDEPLQRLGRAVAAGWLSLGEDECGEEDADPDHDEAVREVERRPVAEVEEVGDEAEPHAVGEVRDAAADHEPERDRQHGMAGAGAREVGEHPGDRDRGDDDHGGRRVREEAEGDAGVLDVPDRERADDVERPRRAVRLPATTCFVTWSATTAASAIAASASHCRRVAANERVARESGVKASVAEPTRTSSCRRGSFTLPRLFACSRCRARPRDSLPAARAESPCRS